jgi:hypothetical protein
MSGYMNDIAIEILSKCTLNSEAPSQFYGCRVIKTLLTDDTLYTNSSAICVYTVLISELLIQP